MSQPYTTRSGATQIRPSENQLVRAIKADLGQGFCLACGAKAHGVEPDARKYTCEGCGAPKVYGAEELLLMGIYHREEARA
jgi:hypothetical protein